MDRNGRAEERFPLRYALFFLVPAVGLIVSGLALWFTAYGDETTATSDLGLALMGGGLAVAGASASRSWSSTRSAVWTGRYGVERKPQSART
jgi:hypothetical protein